MYIHCPKCKSAATIPIVYGKPTPETIEASKHGLIHTAGCVMFDERINRHCKECGSDFIAYTNEKLNIHQGKSIPIKEMASLLDELETTLKALHQEIEREYMRLGRETQDANYFEIFGIMRMHHEAWLFFMDNLHRTGDPTIVLNYDGKIMASYSNSTARMYLIKNNYDFFYLMGNLAKACHWLGRTSRNEKNDIDDLKNASIAVQNARQEMANKWKEFASLALTYHE